MSDGRSAHPSDRTRACVELTLRRIVDDVVAIPGQLLGDIRPIVDVVRAPLSIVTGLAGLIANGVRAATSSPDPAPPPRADTSVRSATVAPTAADRPGPSSTGLPLEGYESLAASQVVDRLPTLSDDELDRIDAFETAHRGRRTVLGKIEQLRTRR